jgi:hypothetical protein
MTGAAKWKPSAQIEVGNRFEFALTEHTNFFRKRLGVDWIVRY